MSWKNFLALSLLPVTLAVSGLTSAVSASELSFSFHQNRSSLKLDPILIAQKEQRTALVIGNSNYGKNGALANPVNDATDVAQALRELGFEVIFLRDASRKETYDAIEQFNAKLRRGGVGLFYFAGHGLQNEGENYLIPIGANISREQDIREEAVALGRVLGAMEDAKNPLNLVLIDACRNNPFQRSWRSATPGLAFISAATGTLSSFATAPGKVAQDGYGARSRNSPDTASLLEQIKIPNLRVEEMFKNVRRSVLKKTRNRQTPWESTSLTGNFSFIKNGREADIETTVVAETLLESTTVSEPSESIPSSDPPVSQRMLLAQSIDDIELQLQTCKPQGDGLRCEFLVKDQAQNRQICIYGIYGGSKVSNVVNSRGMRYSGKSVRFGTAEGRSSNPICQKLSQGIGVKAFITFEDVPKQTEPFSLVEVIVRESGKKLMYMQFRDVPSSSR